MDINKLNRIAKRVAASNDINIVQSVIDGGSYNESDAIESINNIINQSGNQEAKKLLDKMVKNSKTASNSKTAGASEWINEIKGVAKKDSRILMALLAAGMIYVSVPAKAAENALPSTDAVSMVKSLSPAKDMADWMYMDARGYICATERAEETKNSDEAYYLRKFRMEMNSKVCDMLTAFGKKDNVTLDKAFKAIKNRLVGKYGKDNMSIMENSYKKYCDQNQINPSLVKCKMPDNIQYPSDNSAIVKK